MKITATESGQAKAGARESTGIGILPAGSMQDTRDAECNRRPPTSREEAIGVAMAAVAEIPDVREDLVADLKAKIERGEYSVRGEDVAEMMLRRMRADSLR